MMINVHNSKNLLTTMNMNEEVRDGYTVSAQMKKVWSIQMDLLSKILKVCHDNGLKIWVDGGTLLGTIRHHGYIPWDDDIDLLMLREDYDHLLQIVENQPLSPPIFYRQHIPTGSTRADMHSCDMMELQPYCRMSCTASFTKAYS